MQAVFHSSINQIDAKQWDALWPGTYPFTRTAFLSALESSGSVDSASDQTGWTVEHLCVEDSGKLVAAVPLFKKTHSYGEYVFDWSWASAYDQARLNYYPKLINAIPFTPASGPRIGFHPDLKPSERASVSAFIAEAISEHLLKMDYSGFHSLFPDQDSSHLFRNTQFHQRIGYQFHWFNNDYQNFDHFLEHFSSRKRKNIKKERKKTALQGLDIKTRHAADISTDDWNKFSTLYQRTYLKRSGHTGYLGASFFRDIAEALPQQVLLVSAHHAERMIAAALYFRDEENLYGRYWGTEVDIDGLHFECCYYRGIEYAIRHKIKRFDPGAQGEHKIQRGFTPVKTHSFHRLAHPGFHTAVGDFVKKEAAQINFYIKDARSMLPFREGVELVGENVLVKGLAAEHERES